MTTKEIQLIVGKNRVLAGHTCVCENVSSLLDYRELDVMSIRNGKLYEYEVKITRQDFLADRKKKKHQFTGEKGIMIPDMNPNFFSYVCPEDMIRADELPAYSGLYYIIDGELVQIKKPPLYNKHMHDLDKIQKKVLRISQERHFLGGCLMTYKNRQAEASNRKYAPELFLPAIKNRKDA